RYVSLNMIAPRYFETLGTPLVAGRDFSFDDAAGPRVAIVNQAFARYYFADGSPLGKHLTIDWDDRPYEIVGVSADASTSICTSRRRGRSTSTPSRTAASGRC